MAEFFCRELYGVMPNPVRIAYAQIPLASKTVLVTGANSGIGAVAAHSFASSGAIVYMACRNEEKTKPVIDKIIEDTSNQNVHFLKLDLASFESITDCVREMRSKALKLDILVNNAGIACSDNGITASGFETTFAVNHLGPFLFTDLIIKGGMLSRGARIVNVSSRAHYRAPGIDFGALRRATATRLGMHEYGVSKLANVLHAKGLASRFGPKLGITTYSLHPGAVATDVWRGLWSPLQFVIKLFILSVERGTETTMFCATSVQAGEETGLYYDSCKAVKPSEQALSKELEEELWAKSVAWTAPFVELSRA